MFYWIVCLMRLVFASDAESCPDPPFLFLPAESCPDPPPVNNSLFVATEVEGQLLGTYFCIPGFHLVGKASLVCNASEEWDVSFTECRLGHCPNPVLANGNSNSSGPVNVGDKITFKCNDQYILKGSNWSQCLEDHTWEPPLPTCKSRDCDPPGNLVHGYFEGGNFTSGSVVTYYCEERYRLVGTQELQCIDGQWSSELPACEPIQKSPKPAAPSWLEKALLVFRKSEDLCSAVENLVKGLKQSSLTLEEVKHFLEVKKAKLETNILLKYNS